MNPALPTCPTCGGLLLPDGRCVNGCGLACIECGFPSEHRLHCLRNGCKPFRSDAHPFNPGPAQQPEPATQKREPGCQCDKEIGDSPCRVHGEDEQPEPATGCKNCGRSDGRHYSNCPNALTPCLRCGEYIGCRCELEDEVKQLRAENAELRAEQADKEAGWIKLADEFEAGALKLEARLETATGLLREARLYWVVRDDSVAAKGIDAFLANKDDHA